MIQCVRKIQFCAGHRVMAHESKCRNLHGHQYELEIFATSDQLDHLGRVIDFSVLKGKIGGWVDRYWDHGFILFGADTEAWAAVESVSGQKMFSLPYNPTAENIAWYMLKTVCPELMAGTGVRVWKVVCHETPNCRAEASELLPD